MDCVLERVFSKVLHRSAMDTRLPYPDMDCLGQEKTHSLFGKKEKDIIGAMTYAITNVQNVKSYKVHSIFEEYFSMVTYVKDHPENDPCFYLKGQVFYLVGSEENLTSFKTQTTLKDDVIKDVRGNTGRGEIKETNVDTFIKLLENIHNSIDVHRHQKKRIRETKNNTTSSRSHLYYIIEFELKNGKSGYLSIIDQAGKEKPFTLLRGLSSKTPLAVLTGQENETSKFFREKLVHN